MSEFLIALAILAAAFLSFVVIFAAFLVAAAAFFIFWAVEVIDLKASAALATFFIFSALDAALAALAANLAAFADCAAADAVPSVTRLMTIVMGVRIMSFLFLLHVSWVSVHMVRSQLCIGSKG